MRNKTRINALREWVIERHADQKRKYTGKPYYTHLDNVREIVSRYSLGFGAEEIALCHDLLEDTKTTMFDLDSKLIDLGYKSHDRGTICRGVKGLTDVYTSEDYPRLNRATRKHKERIRLENERAMVQSIKCADLIDNTSSIVEHDIGFAKVYLREKEDILEHLKRGNKALLQLAKETLEEAKIKLWGKV